MARDDATLLGPNGPSTGIGSHTVVHIWTGSGPSYMHVHHGDDEIWHVLEGTLGFRIGDKEARAPAGTTVIVPAGVPHTYWEVEPSRYLIVLTHNLNDLISTLHATGGANLLDTLRQYNSDLVE